MSTFITCKKCKEEYSTGIHKECPVCLYTVYDEDSIDDVKRKFKAQEAMIETLSKEITKMQEINLRKFCKNMVNGDPEELLEEAVEYLHDLKGEWYWKKDEPRAGNQQQYDSLEKLIIKIQGRLGQELEKKEEKELLFNCPPMCSKCKTLHYAEEGCREQQDIKDMINNLN